MSKKVVLGITGASGAIYARRFIEVCKDLGELHVVHSQTAPLVFKEELDEDMSAFLKEYEGKVTVHKNKDFLSPLASGSNHFDAYVVMPCSMKTLGQIRSGTGESLLTRIADIAMKERRKLVLVVREAPFSTLMLENMLRISEVGGTILPACPGFYHKPQEIGDLVDFVVGRAMQCVGWGSITQAWKS